MLHFVILCFMLMKMLWKKPVGKEKLFASAYSIAASC